MNVFIMDGSIVKPFGRGVQNNLIGYAGEHGSRTFVIRTMDDISDYTVISLIIDTVDCGSMTRTHMPDGSTMLSLVLTSDIMKTSGNRMCQLMMTDGEKIMKSSQFCAYVSKSNNIEDALPDGATLTIINETITRIIDDAVNEITDASTQAVAEVNAAGRLAKESIPSDYNALNTQVRINTTDIATLNESLGVLITSTAYPLTDGFYKNTSFNSAKVWTGKDVEPVALSGLSYAIIPVHEGDEVILTAANNNSTYRTYILVDDSTNKVYASSVTREEGSVIPVTADGTLVVNNRTSYVANPSIVIRKNSIGNDVEALATRTAVVETELQSIDKEGISAVLQVAEQGHATIDGDWRIGSWTSSGWAASYKYRVGLATQFRTEKDLEVVCERGYQLAITSVCDDETVVSSGSFACNFKIPAHSNSKITMRRINEDTSEVLTDADIPTFANALHIVSMPWTDYERLKFTFFGIEMFKSMTIIGDSYSAGANGENWGTCMERLTGVDVTVLAQSGIGSVGWLNTYLSVLLANPATELYWLNLGINDGSSVDSDPSYLGSLADIDPDTYPDYDNYPQTFYGCTGRIIKNIQAHAPSAKIVIQKTLFGNMRNAQTDTQTTDTKTINDAIAVIAEYYGIPCLDQLDDPFYVSTEYARSMASNHPRKYAWVGMANANRRLLSKAILSNPEYFY